MRTIVVVLLALACVGCASHEVVQFQPKANQQAMVRDGVSALVSRRANSIVMIQPAGRQFQAGGRPVFVVGINNLSNGPLNFVIENIRVTQTINGKLASLKVVTYEELVREEKTRQAVSESAKMTGKTSTTAFVRLVRSSLLLRRRAYKLLEKSFSPTSKLAAVSLERRKIV